MPKEEKYNEIDMEIEEFIAQPGQIVGVVGRVGSGKSTLLSAVLGEIYKISGSTKVGGRTAYCPQTPWLMN